MVQSNANMKVMTGKHKIIAKNTREIQISTMLNCQMQSHFTQNILAQLSTSTQIKCGMVLFIKYRRKQCNHFSPPD